MLLLVPTLWIKTRCEKAVEAIVKDLDKQSVQVGNSSEIKQVASISVNNDETIGSLITEAFEKVGKEGVITVEEAKGTDTYVDVVEGCSLTEVICLHICHKR